MVFFGEAKMIEQINPDFNPDEILNRLEQLSQNSTGFQNTEYKFPRCFSDALVFLDNDRELILRKAIDLYYFFDIKPDEIFFNDVVLDSNWALMKPVIENGVEYYDTDEDYKGEGNGF